LRAARILNENNEESFILVKNNLAIARDEIIDQTELDLPGRLKDFLLTEFMNKVANKLHNLKFKSNVKDFHLLTPIPEPAKIICLNFNYNDQDNWIRFGKAHPKEPIFYLKPRTSLTGPYDDIICPRFITQLDFEGELIVVIGKCGKNISEDDALDHVLGYMIINDVSARDIQYKDIQVSRSKSFDTFGPCGPWITTKDEVKDPNNLSVRTKVNGEIRQNSSTANMVLKVDEVISKLSKVMTLETGDLIATGTPMGTILSSGGKKKFLQTGDKVEIELEDLGKIENTIVFVD
jgi:2-keto-4-pentenoate hydratase/2-oxohepta-3-ene-1,7-dioic acid hydratase in catechol pathway